MSTEDPRDGVARADDEPGHVSEDQRREILRRSEAYRRNPGMAVPLEEALDRIERSLN